MYRTSSFSERGYNPNMLWLGLFWEYEDPLSCKQVDVIKHSPKYIEY
jgi:hypothetical protein